jgi:hypothetical protein
MNSSVKINSKKKKSKTRRELDDEFSEALALADAARAKAAKARDEVQKATAEAIRKGEALKERIRAEKANADACGTGANFDGHESLIHSGTRELLVKALGMLGSDQVGERAAAALMAEKQRVKLGKTWNELVASEHDDEDPDDDLDDADLDDDDEDLDGDLDDDDEEVE